jgi:site-specific DNA-cytosine methylase
MGLPTEQMLEINENGTSNAVTTVQKDNVVVYPKSEYKGIAVHPLSKKLEFTGFKDGNCPTLLATDYKAPKCVLFDFTNDFGEGQPIEYTETAPSLRSSRSGLAVNSNQEIKTKKLTDKQLDKLENLVVDENIAGCITEAIGRAGSSDEYMSSVKRNAINTQRIRRLTPRECFILMDFNFGIPNVPDFKWEVSDSQAYKQAGNSIVVNVLCEIIKKLKL